MKTFLILGAGSAGTMIAHKMVKALDSREWQIIVVDKNTNHFYQPGFLFLPFGYYTEQDVIKPQKNFIPSKAKYINSDIEIIEADNSQVKLTNGEVIHYDYMVIATGADIQPQETEGLMDGGWRQNIFDFYTVEGGVALKKFLDGWQGGRLVVNVVENPIKCPVAPLEFLFLADDYFTKKGIRNKVDIVYATPLSGAFTKPVSSAMLGELLARKNIRIEPDFAIGEVDSGKNVIRSYDDREIGYDLLVSVPTNMGADVIARSGLGDELNYVPTDKHTLQSKKYQNIFVLGDAANIPASKAGAVIHFQMETAFKNIMAHIQGKPMPSSFDGHSLCYIESGYKKAILIDFSYDQEPLPGMYPLAGIGPFSLLRETTVNHWGKLAFKEMYWNLMLKGIEVPLPSQFSMSGKENGVPAVHPVD
jgi:sulfide:quinone oxidoreductase